MITFADLGAEALTLAGEQGLDFTDPGACAWALLRDAAKTFSAGAGDGPRGYPKKSAMPEQVRSRWEIFAVERERITSRVQVDTDARWTPTARQITRAEAVLERLWTPQTFRGHVAYPELSCKACWLHAGGVSTRRVARHLRTSQPSVTRWKAKLSLIVGRIILPNLERKADEMRKSA